ncbi:MAG: hypothetical protein PUK66_04975 [Bacteroidales bacterium]|uniref:cell division protein FtsQ/DivIB n=1 Tax=Porphyromonas sp. TaxID=1924944 RepID=UPI0029780811|nr:hypothetical protein [Porphyromonas sp.]MDD7438176.1 hypothetical protein [Bacteroidales bacterium]MDY3066823.1 hypothetical protein [Porphyromonas sp.]
MKRKLLQLLLWLFATVLLGGLVFGYIALQGRARYAIQPNLTRVKVSGVEKDAFLKKDDIMAVLPVSIQDTLPQPISLTEVERTIKSQIPYAKKVSAYVSPTNHQMTVRVDSRRPILRFYTNDGAFYLDDEGTAMRTKSGASIYVPVVKTDHVDSLTIRNTLFPLAQFLSEHDEWNTFFSFIELKEGNRIHLYPRVGDYVFEVLGTSTLEEDLPKIHIFYTKIVPQVGANRYQLIKLSYNKQIVCKRREQL